MAVLSKSLKLSQLPCAKLAVQDLCTVVYHLGQGLTTYHGDRYATVAVNRVLDNDMCVKRSGFQPPQFNPVGLIPIMQAPVYGTLGITRTEHL